MGTFSQREQRKEAKEVKGKLICNLLHPSIIKSPKLNLKNGICDG